MKKKMLNEVVSASDVKPRKCICVRAQFEENTGITFAIFTLELSLIHWNFILFAITFRIYWNFHSFFVTLSHLLLIFELIGTFIHSLELSLIHWNFISFAVTFRIHWKFISFFVTFFVTYFHSL